MTDVIEMLTGADIVSTILLMRDTETRAILVMEAETDCGIVDSHLDDGCAVSLPAHGKNNVLEALAELSVLSCGHVVGVVDADFSTQSIVHGSVIVTDNYDLDIDVMLVPNILRRFALAHFDAPQLGPRRPLQNQSDVRATLELAAPIGALRRASQDHMLGLNMRDFPAESIFDLEAFECNRRRLVEVAIGRSSAEIRNSVDPDMVLQHMLDQIIASEQDLIALVSGHDACAIMSLIARRNGAKGMGKGLMERSVRGLLGCAEFSSLKVVAKLDAWSGKAGLTLWDH